MKLTEIKDVVQEAIDNGATTVEEIHKSIANKPFEFLERLNIQGDTIDKLQSLQNRTIGSVYESIRSITEKAGEIAEDMLSKIEK